MQKLATLIEERLKERAFCLIFAPDLESCWPSEKWIVRSERDKSKPSRGLMDGTPRSCRLNLV